TVGIDADRKNFRPELPKRIGRDFVSRAICTIDHDAQTYERYIARQCPLGEFDIAVLHAVDTLGAPEIGGFCKPLAEVRVDQLLDLTLDFVGKLEAVRTEQL